MTVCAVIPAYNEAERIASVLDTLAASPSVDRILVVDDGSNDGTADVVRAHPAAGERLRVLSQPNGGKGAAMRHGAEEVTDTDVLLFFDADLIGLTVEHVEALLAPVLAGTHPMALGVFRGGNFWTTLAQKLAPNISGQRAIERELFLCIPNLVEARYGVELAITGFVMEKGLPVARVELRDVSHPPKEKKLGFLRGVASRVRMYGQMMPFLLRRYMSRQKKR
ncbi:MAG: glycosyltransferase family 2 protein [Armatimonas sp.]